MITILSYVVIDKVDDDIGTDSDHVEYTTRIFKPSIEFKTVNQKSTLRLKRMSSYVNCILWWQSCMWIRQIEHLWQTSSTFMVSEFRHFIVVYCSVFLVAIGYSIANHNMVLCFLTLSRK